jgi:Cellulase (glycosyl hydrolase family 5)/Glycoside hydrolase family 5 C-terminal domain
MNLQNRRLFIKKLLGTFLFLKIFPKISLSEKIIGYANTKKSSTNSVDASYSFDPGTARDITRDSSFFFRDAEKRYVLLRGVNWGSRSKLPPYLPNYPLWEKTITQSDNTSYASKAGAIMKKMGFNIVRLCVMWKGFEPKPLTLNDKNHSELDDTGKQYLNEVYKIVEELNRYGVFVIIDFHQDIAHELYGGDGFPDWAIGIDKDHPQPAPSPPDNAKWGLNYFDFPKHAPHSGLVRNTLQSFWKNSLINTRLGLSDYPVQDHLVNVIGQVSKFFIEKKSQSRTVVSAKQGHPAIFGYEPFNEPHQVGLGKENFESVLLPAYYSKSVSRIRESDKKAFLFLEPRMDWTVNRYNEPEASNILKAVQYFINEKNPQTDVKSFLDVSKINDSRLIFSFHYYDPYTIFHLNFPVIMLHDSMKDKKRDWPELFKVFISNGTSKNLMPFLTEFGGDQKWLKAGCDIDNPVYDNKLLLAYQDLIFQQIEANMLNSIYWNFDLFNTKDNGDNWNQEDFSIISPDGAPLQEEIIVRPYPMRSSAKPTFLHFDVLTKHFVLIMEGNPVNAPTVIFTPDVQYHGEFEIRCTGVAPNGLIRDSKEQLFYWYPDSSQTKHMLIFCPKGKFDPAILPDEALNLLTKCVEVTSNN